MSRPAPERSCNEARRVRHAAHRVVTPRHFGRATTLAEAILEHAASNNDTASEARAARAAYLSRSLADKQALIAFLENLVLFKVEEEEEAAAAGALTALQSLAGVQSPRQQVKIAPKGFRIRLE